MQPVNADDQETMGTTPLSTMAIAVGPAARGRRRLRLLLALLLTLSPLLGIAQQAGPFGAPEAPAAATGMPCHALQADPAHLDGTGEPAGCSHCSGDTARATCGCCGPLSPAGLAWLAACAVAPRGTLPWAPIGHQQTLPESPAETPYRPPIARA